jgi:hypothetical protein
MKLVIRLIVTACILSLSWTAVAGAQQMGPRAGSGFGLRVGFGLDPDQLVIGGQFAIVQPNNITRIVPSVDVGLGNSITTILFNADVLFRLVLEGTQVGFYGGGAGTAAYIDASGVDGTWELGIPLIVGVGLPVLKRNSTSIEGRFGIIGDIPDFRLLGIISF